ncbi:DUF4817 domain-containing protein [Trichonephila clavipes]|nr:DUF4817 domain-containing protein [Trichonephila clavipes]
MMFCKEQRIVIEELYFAVKSHCRVINAFQQKYPGETAPNASTITVLVQRFHGTGSVADRKRTDSEKGSDRCGDQFTKKSIEKTVRLHKHHHGIHILAELMKEALGCSKRAQLVTHYGTIGKC